MATRCNICSTMYNNCNFGNDAICPNCKKPTRIDIAYVPDSTWPHGEVKCLACGIILDICQLISNVPPIKKFTKDRANAAIPPQDPSASIRCLAGHTFNITVKQFQTLQDRVNRKLSISMPKPCLCIYSAHGTIMQMMVRMRDALIAKHLINP